MHKRHTLMLLPPGLMHAVLAAILVGPALASDTPPQPAAAPFEVANPRLREALIEGANRGEAYRMQAADRPSPALLAELIERELAAETPRQALSAAQIVRAETLGEVFVAEIEASGSDWRRQMVTLLDDDGTSFQVAAGDFGNYLVLSQHPEIGNLILIDPSPQPKHPCCVMVETTLFDDHLHDAYSGLSAYFASEWAMSKALRD